MPGSRMRRVLTRAALVAGEEEVSGVVISSVVTAEWVCLQRIIVVFQLHLMGAVNAAFVVPKKNLSLLLWLWA